MTDWIDEYGAELQGRLDGSAAGLRPDDGTVDALLGLAAVVAHGTERKNAPVATYVAGYFAALRGEGGLAEAIDLAREMLPGE